MENRDINALGRQLLYHRYLMSEESFRRQFQKLNPTEYNILRLLSDEPEGKLCLRTLAERLDLSIRWAGRMARSLRDRGLADWTHDGCGENGTYIRMTPFGARLLAEEEALLGDFHSRVVERYGAAEMEQLLQMLERLQDVMRKESEAMDGTDDEDDAD